MVQNWFAGILVFAACLMVSGQIWWSTKWGQSIFEIKFSYWSKTGFFLSLSGEKEIITNIREKFRRFWNFVESENWDWWNHLMNSLYINLCTVALFNNSIRIINFSCKSQEYIKEECNFRKTFTPLCIPTSFYQIWFIFSLVDQKIEKLFSRILPFSRFFLLTLMSLLFLACS